jgi:hypothetical protein
LHDGISKSDGTRSQDAHKIPAFGVKALTDVIRNTETIAGQEHSYVKRDVFGEFETNMVWGSEPFHMCSQIAACAVITIGIFSNPTPPTIPAPPNGVDANVVPNLEFC